MPVFVLAGELRNIIEHLGHRHDRQPGVNAESLHDFFLETIGRSEEHNLGAFRPPAQEQVLLSLKNSFQHVCK